MLDDLNLLAQRDPENTRLFTEKVMEQVSYNAEVQSMPDANEALIQNIIITGMGGSALAADMVNALTSEWMAVPLSVVKGYKLPGFANENTLVIAVSHSGNTEETLGCYDDARQRNCHLAVISTGGQLSERAETDGLPIVKVPQKMQPRMSTVYHLKALLKLLQSYDIIGGELHDELTDSYDWLAGEVVRWGENVPTEQNYAKQLALKLIGKTPVFYAGETTRPLAYKWKISLNESSKNMAFCGSYPEFNHNEFIGWTSHPVEKPFAVVDLRSELERPRIRQRMEISDRLLSGMRPKAEVIELEGSSLVRQFLWSIVLADMVSIYVGILNNVNPAPVALIEKLKLELA